MCGALGTAGYPGGVRFSAGVDHRWQRDVPARRGDRTVKVNYLVVCANGNPCWAYACYGRKVEQAVKHRRQGVPIVLVHENDFWDAYEDAI